MSIPIFLSSDNNYAPFVATTMASICDNTDSFCEFYVLDGGISKENQEKICELKNKFENFSIEFINIKKEDLCSIEYRNECKYVTLSTYNRFLIPKLKPAITKAIYLDVDIILNCDIKELFEINLENYSLGAIVDQSPDVVYINNIKNELQIKGEYFNAGVLLINCTKWRDNKITQKLFELENKYRNKLKMADQDVLNICFDSNYKVLDKKYNVMYQNDIVKLRHFTSIIKPWQADFYIDSQMKRPKPIKDIDKFWKYAKITPFYNEILKRKEDFLNSNILYKRLNKMVAEGKIK